MSISASTDNPIIKNFYKYAFGRYQQWFGLEPKLADFDIVHAGELYNYYTYQAVRAKRRYHKLKVVATVWENIFGRFEYNYWPGFGVPPRYWREKLRAIIDANARGVDMFLPATQDAAELLLDYGVPREHITVVTPGIVPPEKEVQPVLPAALCGREVYMMVSRLVKEKGVYEILYGFKRYIARTYEPHKKVLVMVGTGPEEKNLRRLVREWQFEEYVTFIRQLPYTEMLGLYRGAKCLILGSVPMPAWQEQFGYVLGEAISADVPVIATYSGAIPEVVGRAGILVPPAHPIALSQALLELDQSEVYTKVKSACAEEKKKFVATAYAEKVADVYRALVSV